jgi:hypothetical protein
MIPTFRFRTSLLAAVLSAIVLPPSAGLRAEALLKRQYNAAQAIDRSDTDTLTFVVTSDGSVPARDYSLWMRRYQLVGGSWQGHSDSYINVTVQSNGNVVVQGNPTRVISAISRDNVQGGLTGIKYQPLRLDIPNVGNSNVATGGKYEDGITYITDPPFTPEQHTTGVCNFWLGSAPPPPPPPPPASVTFTASVECKSLDGSAVRLVMEGEVKYSQSIGPGSNAQPLYVSVSATVNGLDRMTTGSAIWQVQHPRTGEWFDAVAVAYSVYDPPEIVSEVEHANIQILGNTPAEPEEPPKTPPPPPETTDPKPNDDNRPPPTVPVRGNGGNQLAQEVDVYDDVRNALNDAGNADTTMATISRDFDAGDHPEGISESYDTLQAIDHSARGITKDVGNLTDDFKGKMGTAAMSLPSVGVAQLVFPVSLPVLGSFSVDISPFSAIIGYMRNLCLLLLYITFWVAAKNAIRSSIA